MKRSNIFDGGKIAPEKIRRDLVEITDALPVIGGVSSTEFDASVRATLTGTILDPQFEGKDVYIDLAKVSDDKCGFPAYQNGKKLPMVIIPWEKRHGLRKLPGTNTVQVTPLLAVTNDLVRECRLKDRVSIALCMRRWGAAYSEEVRRELDTKVGRPRNPFSGALVVTSDIRKDAFEPSNFFAGNFSSLAPGQMGVSQRVFDKLTNKSFDSRLAAQNTLAAKLRTATTTAQIEKIQSKIAALEPVVKPGSKCVASRWPSTDAIPQELVVMKSKDPKSMVIYSPVDQFMFLDTSAPKLDAQGDVVINPINAMKEIEGDKDGDAENFVFPTTAAGIAQTAELYLKHYSNCFRTLYTPQPLTYKDHEDIEAFDEKQMLKDKMEQKLWIGALSILMYAYYAWAEKIRARGDVPPVSYKAWMEASTESLEKCFDKKHNNGSDPRPLYGLMMGKKGYTFDRVGAAIAEQGLDVEVYGKVATALMGGSIRDSAMQNTAFRVSYLLRNSALPGERESVIFGILQGLPEDKSLAQWYADELIPSLHMQDIAPDSAIQELVADVTDVTVAEDNTNDPFDF